ncbi:hypothetical protein A6764_09035 [Brevibacillus sp. WF146]|uniref:hypothetical protein n=1 Tax=Brevibacillus sp. WF146 TaxID=319501 RepID=UPI000ACD2490|nr:hypothetical protein [Brevibacillus sp. WF146]UYZ15050.1 hypothetical protein A6764_09035 [Brevibacillus sp. WF146]
MSFEDRQADQSTCRRSSERADGKTAGSFLREGGRQALASATTLTVPRPIRLSGAG